MRVAVRQPHHHRPSADSLDGRPASGASWLPPPPPPPPRQSSGRGSADGASGVWGYSDDVAALIPSADGSMDSLLATLASAAPAWPAPLAAAPPLRVPAGRRTSVRLSGDGVLAVETQPVSSGDGGGGASFDDGAARAARGLAAAPAPRKLKATAPRHSGRPRAAAAKPLPPSKKQKPPPPFTPQSSSFRGVSRHRSTRRWEASIWLAGKQVYLGGFEEEEDAARAYDVAALAVRGAKAATNFGAACYAADLAELRGAPAADVVAHLRRRSAAFSRGRSPFRGVSGGDGRWEARIGVLGRRKNVSLGLHHTEEAAARAYDRALIVERGRTAKTNFAVSEYDAEVAAAAGEPASFVMGATPLRPAAAAATVCLGDLRAGLARM